MARGAGEPSAKRAKVDEADEEEDPLVRRKEEVVRLLEKASAKGKGNARAKKELVTLCADFEAKNEKLLGRLLPELWQKILDQYLHQNDLLALAMTCRFFREKQKDLGKKMETNVGSFCLLDLRKSVRMPSHTLVWFQWVCDTFEIKPGFERSRERVEGAVYEGDLVNYAALQGSVEILRWLMDEKEWELNFYTGEWAGMGGSVEVLEYLWDWGYEFNDGACGWAAEEGHLEALKYLKGLNLSCFWDEWTCASAAKGGHLEVLKYLRAQDPPCSWDEMTCAWAAEGGHLDVLKWLRSQDPPCPWSRDECREEASMWIDGHQRIVDWIERQPMGDWDY